MTWNGIERNKLDYILTDLLPVELSESFSFRQFYDFLLSKINQKKLTDIVNELKVNQAQSEPMLFRGNWATTPLKYRILKGNDDYRELSIVQPLSALNLYLFIELYQKDILSFFNTHHHYSIRYHKRSTDLFYKSRNNQATRYFSKHSRIAKKKAIQQTGNYFKIVPFESINSFTDSRVWRMSNFRYRYFARMDYKSCFDSVYSHVYKWIIERITVDSKNANNTNLFIIIDRILQNINGLSSNGLIVGPEFSRMIAEVLLQYIDDKVLIELSNLNIVFRRDYVVFRFVDDFFVFANSQENIETIISTFKKESSFFLMRFNELKLAKGETPCLPKNWLEKTRRLADILENFFYKGTKAEYTNLDEDMRYIVKTDYMSIDRFKDEVITVMKEHTNDRRTIVSFLISVLLNNIGKKKDGFRLFKESSNGKAFLLIDLALFIYAFFPSYDQTRKLISIIVYMNDEINFNKIGSKQNQQLQEIIRRYSFVFEKGNLPDLCDWFLFLGDFNISLNMKSEDILLEKAVKDNNPIILANILMYSRYNENFFKGVSSIVSSIISENLIKLSEKSPDLQMEYWFILVFHNCPHITASLKAEIDNLISKTRPRNVNLPLDIIRACICDFLQLQSPAGNKPKDSFFNWNDKINTSEQITYRTFQRTIFKNYRGNKYGLYVSLD